jgi:hypothetical protein
MIHLLPKQDGVYLVTMPEEQYGECFQRQGICVDRPQQCLCDQKQMAYDKALKEAKETSIICADQKQASILIGPDFNTGAIYPIEGWDARIEQFKNDKDADVASGYSNPPQTVARLIPAKQSVDSPCEPPKESESQKDTLLAFMNLLFSSSIDKALEKFTITRK